MFGRDIIVSGFPQGKPTEGTISGTPKPGTVMQRKASTEPVGGRGTWEVYNADADGNQREIAILTEDFLQGKTFDDAYVDGSRGFLYRPIMGETFNMRVSAAGTGTDDSQAIGALYMVDDGTGFLVATTGTPESEAFINLETASDVVSDGSTLLHVEFTGY